LPRPAERIGIEARHTTFSISNLNLNYYRQFSFQVRLRVLRLSSRPLRSAISKSDAASNGRELLSISKHVSVTTVKVSKLG